LIRRVAIVAGSLLALLVGAAFWFDVPRFIIGIATYGQQMRSGTLEEGDPVPSVTLYALDGSTPRELREFVGNRPLVLIFGSFT